MWTLGLIVRRWFVIVSVKMVTVYYIISSINLMKSTVSVAVVLYEYSVCLGSGWCWWGPGKKKSQGG